MSKPFHHISARKSVPLFIFGDHASRLIPGRYNDLGLTGEDLTRHIAWDIGTETVIRTLCEEIGCAGQLAGVSRLVIDLNRELELGSLIPEISDGTIIPGNQNLSPAERQRRIDDYYRPYHAAISDNLETMGFGLAISVHSFTPRLKDQEPRPLEIGLLHKSDAATANLFQAELAKLQPKWRTAHNEPYSAFDLNFTIDEHVGKRGLPHLSIEINQAMIDTNIKAKSVAGVLAQALGPIITKIEKAV